MFLVFGILNSLNCFIGGLFLCLVERNLGGSTFINFSGFYLCWFPILDFYFYFQFGTTFIREEKTMLKLLVLILNEEGLVYG